MAATNFRRSKIVKFIAKHREVSKLVTSHGYATSDTVGGRDAILSELQKEFQITDEEIKAAGFS